MAQISGFRHQRKICQSDQQNNSPTNTTHTKFKFNDIEIVLHDILPESNSNETNFSTKKLDESRKQLREKRKADTIELKENRIRLRKLKKEEADALKQRKRERKLNLNTLENLNAEIEKCSALNVVKLEDRAYNNNIGLVEENRSKSKMESKKQNLIRRPNNQLE